MKTSTVKETQILKRSNPLRVLILEHSPHDVELMLWELRQAGVLLEHTVAENAEEFRRVIREQRFDAVLADCGLPGWTGPEALQELRAEGIDIPFLVVMGAPGEEAAAPCVK